MIASPPLLPGCHPDPSICRSGEYYYLVTSTFAWYPGIPVHRSRDLRSWELIGHVLIDESWIPLEADVDLSDGVWAPTIREHDGVFYVVFALAKQRSGSGTYVCVAPDPAGPWVTRPVAGAEGIDPSLYFDDDGRCWFTAVRDTSAPTATGPGEIWMREFDIRTFELIGPRHALWSGAVAGQWVEGPHIFKRGDTYHLIAAEGGTERYHAVTAAHAPRVEGPYTTDRRSPLLTHRHLAADFPIQNVGHADLVDSPDGRTWATVLATRPVDGHHVLGRETFLVPVDWDDDGPVFASAPVPPDSDVRFPPSPTDTDWVSLRGPAHAHVAGDRIVLAPRPHGLSEDGVPAFLGRRQDDHSFTFAATLDTAALSSAGAGVTAIQNESAHVALIARAERDGAVLTATRRLGDHDEELGSIAVHGAIDLLIVGEPTGYTFAVRSGDEVHAITRVSHVTLSTETNGGFVGVLLGVLAIGAVTAPIVEFTGVRYTTPAERIHGHAAQLTAP